MPALVLPKIDWTTKGQPSLLLLGIVCYCVPVFRAYVKIKSEAALVYNGADSKLPPSPRSKLRPQELGDQFGRSFAYGMIVFFGQIF
jgi:hypothetical protein